MENELCILSLMTTLNAMQIAVYSTDYREKKTLLLLKRTNHN